MDYNLHESTQNVPNITIIIPVFNKVELSKRCLESIYKSINLNSEFNTFPPLNFEIIVVDNGSFDSTPELIRSFKSRTSKAIQLKHIQNSTNLGFAKACNIGAQAALGKYLIFLNNDTEVFPNSLSKLHETLTKNPSVGIVGSRLLYPNYTIQHAGMALDKDFEWHHIFRQLPAENPAVLEKRTFQAVTGACFIISKNLFFQVGQFDENYKNSYEDVDLCLKVRQAGKLVIYEPESVLIHHEGMSEGRKQNEDHNRELFLSRWKDQVKVDFEELTQQYLIKSISQVQFDYEKLFHSVGLYEKGPYQSQLPEWQDFRTQLQCKEAQLAQLNQALLKHKLEKTQNELSYQLRCRIQDNESKNKVIEDLHQKLGELSAQVGELQMNKQLAAKHIELLEAKLVATDALLRAVKSSFTYQFGNLILGPLKVVRKMIRSRSRTPQQSTTTQHLQNNSLSQMN